MKLNYEHGYPITSSHGNLMLVCFFADAAARRDPDMCWYLDCLLNQL